MPSFVTFNGITRFLPGGITKVNTDALNVVVAGDNSIVALVGEADGGAPGLQGIVTLFDATRAKDIFRAGPMVDSIPLAFQSGNDENVPGGASRVLLFKTNNSTQSTLNLPAAEADNVIGSPASPNTATGTQGAAILVDTTLAATFADDELNGKWIVLRPFSATTEVRQITDYVASTNTMTVAAWGSAPVDATDDYFVLENEVVLTGALDGASTSTVLDFKAAAGFTDDEFIGRWVFIQDSLAVTFIRQIVDNNATTLTISPALPTAPTTGAYAEILANSQVLTSDDFGAHTNGITADVADGVVIPGSKIATLTFEGEDEFSPETGGQIFMNLLYRGGSENIGDNVDTGSTASIIELVTGGLTPSDHVGTQVLINGEFTTITANTASQLTLSPPLSNAPSAASGGDDVSIRTVTAGTMIVAGASGIATSLSTTLTGVSGDDLSITFTPGMTIRALLDTINANTNYLATVPGAVNPDISLAADFDFGPRTLVTVLNSASVAADGLFQNNVALVAYYNGFSALADSVRATELSVDGCCAPAAFGAGQDPANFAGGTRGISTNTNFQEGFDALLKVRANSVVAQIDEDLVNEGFGSTATVNSVHAQMGAHVGAARGASNSERGGFAAKQGTLDELIAQGNIINDFDVALVGQNPTALNASGSLVDFTPREFAVMAASMRAGVSEVAEPLTHKGIRISGLTQDSSWDPTDLTDANRAIIGGLLFAEPVPSGGFRWVRDLTTHVKDNNLAKSEGSVRDAVRFVAFGLREFLVNRFTGRKASPATISSVKDAAADFLELQRTNNIIVDSSDPATGATIRAFHNLKVTSSGDTVRLSVGFFPVPGINFILNELFVQLATQAA